MSGTITKGRILYNAAKHYLLENYVFPRQKKVQPVNVSELDAILDNYSDEKVVFVHAGLSDVKSAFQCNPYKFLMDILEKHFDSILAPGFTPSFRRSGVYHKLYSEPQYGMFGRLFLEDADYRTDDAIHSIMVKGDYNFDGCDHHDSFSKKGCWGKLDRDNVLYMNIGTPWIITTQHHYVEHCISPVPSHKMHDLMYYSSLYIGEGVTMASESAVLGTPAVFVSTRKLGYLEELDKRYGLVYNFSGRDRQKRGLKKAINILEYYDESEWKRKRQNMLKDKIDVTEFMINIISKYEHS